MENQYKDVMAPVNKHDIIEIDPILKHQMRTEDELKTQQQDIYQWSNILFLLASIHAS